jgi:hypothetical protein
VKVLEGFSLGYGVEEENAGGCFVVGWGKGGVLLLRGGIPDLQF